MTEVAGLFQRTWRSVWDAALGAEKNWRRSHPPPAADVLGDGIVGSATVQGWATGDTPQTRTVMVVPEGCDPAAAKTLAVVSSANGFTVLLSQHDPDHPTRTLVTSDPLAPVPCQADGIAEDVVNMTQLKRVATHGSETLTSHDAPPAAASADNATEQRTFGRYVELCPQEYLHHDGAAPFGLSFGFCLPGFPAFLLPGCSEQEPSIGYHARAGALVSDRPSEVGPTCHSFPSHTLIGGPVKGKSGNSGSEFGVAYGIGDVVGIGYELVLTKQSDDQWRITDAHAYTTKNGIKSAAFAHGHSLLTRWPQHITFAVGFCCGQECFVNFGDTGIPFYLTVDGELTDTPHAVPVPRLVDPAKVHVPMSHWHHHQGTYGDEEDGGEQAESSEDKTNQSSSHPVPEKAGGIRSLVHAHHHAPTQWHRVHPTAEHRSLLFHPALVAFHQHKVSLDRKRWVLPRKPLEHHEQEFADVFPALKGRGEFLDWLSVADLASLLIERWYIHEDLHRKHGTTLSRSASKLRSTESLGAVPIKPATGASSTGTDPAPDGPVDGTTGYPTGPFPQPEEPDVAAAVEGIHLTDAEDALEQTGFQIDRLHMVQDAYKLGSCSAAQASVAVSSADDRTWVTFLALTGAEKDAPTGKPSPWTDAGAPSAEEEEAYETPVSSPTLAKRGGGKRRGSAESLATATTAVSRFLLSSSALLHVRPLWQPGGEGGGGGGPRVGCRSVQSNRPAYPLHLHSYGGVRTYGRYFEVVLTAPPPPSSPSKPASQVPAQRANVGAAPFHLVVGWAAAPFPPFALPGWYGGCDSIGWDSDVGVVVCDAEQRELLHAEHGTPYGATDTILGAGYKWYLVPEASGDGRPGFHTYIDFFFTLNGRAFHTHRHPGLATLVDALRPTIGSASPAAQRVLVNFGADPAMPFYWRGAPVDDEARSVWWQAE